MQQDSATPENEAPSFMLAIVLAAFAGGSLTAFLLWNYAMAVMLASLPLGASAAGSIAAALVYIVHRTGEPDAPPNPLSP